MAGALTTAGEPNDDGFDNGGGSGFDGGGLDGGWRAALEAGDVIKSPDAIGIRKC